MNVLRSAGTLLGSGYKALWRFTPLVGDVNLVGSFILHKGSFEGMHGLNNIVIMKTHIPLLTEGILYNIKDLQEFKLGEVNISKIEKNAVLIDLKQLGSKAEILQSKIGIVEERGLQIGNGSSIILQDTEIHKAEKNSIRLGALKTFKMKGNKFQPEVDIEAAKIIYKNSIEFSMNILLNVDLSDVANIAHMPENETIFTLDRLVTLHGGNYVNCKCINPTSTPSESLKQNRCVNGCSKATVESFLQSCQSNNAVSVEDRLKMLCKNTVDSSTTTAIPQTPPTHKITSPLPTKGSSGKMSFYVLMPFVFFFFHLML
ncbi:Protein of unknown function [Gryllus bimaculatus]|nr:Protein of unknown function [Gryllus bimaculatus]